MFGPQKLEAAKMLPSLKIDNWSKISTDQYTPQPRALSKTNSYQPSVGQKRPQPSDLESEQVIGKYDPNVDEYSNL